VAVSVVSRRAVSVVSGLSRGIGSAGDCLSGLSAVSAVSAVSGVAAAAVGCRYWRFARKFLEHIGSSAVSAVSAVSGVTGSEVREAVFSLLGRRFARSKFGSATSAVQPAVSVSLSKRSRRSRRSRRLGGLGFSGCPFWWFHGGLGLGGPRVLRGISCWWFGAPGTRRFSAD
jgi:hypothetical protein